MSLPAGRIPTTDTTRPFKLGSMSAAEVMSEHRYPNLWDIEKTTGPDRLIVAPESNHVSLMMDLLEELPEPFGILYVLLLARNDEHRAGRYQNPAPSSRAETLSFLREYRDYFERDGRHHIWVSSPSLPATIVYDQHNVLYAYGPLDAFQRVLHRRGLERGVVRFPRPHSHNYNDEYDEAEARILLHWGWRWFPLQEQDDL